PDGGLRGLDAVLEIGGTAQGEAAAAGVPSLSLMVAEPGDPGAPVGNSLGTDPLLDERLRGATLPDNRLGAAFASGAVLQPGGQATVLASCRERPTWIGAGARQTALLAPAELDPDEALRERLRDGRSAA